MSKKDLFSVRKSVPAKFKMTKTTDELSKFVDDGLNNLEPKCNSYYLTEVESL